MKKRHFDITTFLGVVLVIGSLTTGGLAYKMHLDAEADLDRLLETRATVFQTSSPTNEVSNNATTDEESSGSISSNSGEIINEVVTGDQEVSNIKNGTEVIEIPSLDMTLPIIEGTDTNALRKGVGRFLTTASIGERGNIGLAGHSSSIYNCVFNGLDEIKLFEEINLFNSKGEKFTYYVTDIAKVDPTAWYVLNDFGDTRVTVLTCTDSGTMRLCVTALSMTKAELIEYKRSFKKDVIENMNTLVDSIGEIRITEFLSSRDTISPILHGFPQSAFSFSRLEGSVLHKDLSKVGYSNVINR